MRTVSGFLDQEIKPETHTQTQISAPPHHHHRKDHAILKPSPPSPLAREETVAIPTGLPSQARCCCCCTSW